MAGGQPCKCMDGATGRPGIDWRGEYDSEASYRHRDAVSYQGSSYFFSAEHVSPQTGVLPTDTEFWGVLSAGAEGGGGSGVVESVVQGDGILVDSSDPANPIVSLAGGSSDAPTMTFNRLDEFTLEVSETKIVGCFLIPRAVFEVSPYNQITYRVRGVHDTLGTGDIAIHLVSNSNVNGAIIWSALSEGVFRQSDAGNDGLLIGFAPEGGELLLTSGYSTLEIQMENQTDEVVTVKGFHVQLTASISSGN